MHKSWLVAGLVSACAFAVTLPAAAENTLKMAYALSTNSHYGAGADAMAKSLEGSTQGKYKVQQFANSALGGEREVIEGLQIGTVDLAIVSTGATLNFVPETGVFDIPSCCATCLMPVPCSTARWARTCWPSSPIGASLHWRGANRVFDT
ncbi:bacterial extracellular solute-binding, 7 family protein [Bordetella holmesii 44057]|nr:bacterial extracellular solute-binding, 7 family protein [Bordetella holmesii 44057]